MEDNLQTIFIYIISIVLLFIFPVYITYEKKDDISYALVLSYTQNFVDTVKNKGYITKNELTNFIAQISATGNVYDIEMEHKHQSINPIIKKVNCMDRNPDGQLVNSIYIDKTTYDAYTEAQKNALYITYDKVDFLYDYKIDTQIYGTQHINNVLSQDVDYYMNVDDSFSIIVKNRNTTLATVMYNLATIGNVDLNTRIYVNYVGQVRDTKWYSSLEEIKYAITDDNITNHILYNQDEKVEIYKEEYNAVCDSPLNSLASDLTNNFTIELTATLFDLDNDETAITKVIDSGSKISDISSLNMFLTKLPSYSGDIHIELGYNGIAVFQWDGAQFNCITSYAMNDFSPDQIIKIAVKQPIVSIITNDKRVAYGSYTGDLKVTSDHKIPSDFDGIVKIKIFQTSD